MVSTVSRPEGFREGKGEGLEITMRSEAHNSPISRPWGSLLIGLKKRQCPRRPRFCLEEKSKESAQRKDSRRHRAKTGDCGAGTVEGLRGLSFLIKLP